MTVNYTTNLALGQPVTGTESGTWGDDVNNSVTSYLDIAIAGGLAVTITTTDVTLTLTQGTSSATNIGSTTAQYAILNVSGAMTAARNLILPSSSRQYVINNNTTGGFALTVKGSATSGVTMVNGEKAHVFWNGSDYAKLSNTPGGAGTFSSITNTGLTSGRVVYSTTGGLETDSANLTFDGTNLTLAGGTANGVTYLNGSKVLTSGSALTFDGSRVALSTATSNIQLTTTVNTNQAFISLADADGRTAVFRGPNSGTPNCAQIGTTTNHDTAFLYGNSEQMRLTSTGLGIGTSSPGYKLDVQNTYATAWTPNSSAAQLNIQNNSQTANSTSLIQTAIFNADTTFGGVKFGAVAATNYSADFVVANRNVGTFQENVRITASGNLLVGTTSATTYTGNSVIVAQGGASPGGASVSIQHISGSSSGNYYLGFNLNGAGIGSVTQSGTTAVLYNVTSDQRLKENIVDAPDFGSVIDSLQVRSFDWKADQTHQRAGFVAQELVTVAPEAVHQPTDPEEMMAVDYSKLVPMLVKEIQSLRKRLADAGIA